MINKPLSIVDIKNLPEVITLTRDFFPFVAGTKIYKEIVILEKRFISSDILLKYSFSKVEFDGNKGIGHNAVKVSSSEFNKMISEMDTDNQCQMVFLFGAFANNFGHVQIVYSPEGSDFQFSLEQVSNENWFSPLND